jgi:hypothetical protein
VRPREPSLLGQLDPDAYVVEVAALLDILGVEHEIVHLGIPRSKAALFAQDLRTGQAARGVVRSSPGHVLLPDHIETTVQIRLGVVIQVAGWMARAVAHDLEVGRRIRLGLPGFISAHCPGPEVRKQPVPAKPSNGSPSQV